MSSRLFKHQMAAMNRPPVMYPQLFIGHGTGPASAHIYNMTPETNSFVETPKPADLTNGVLYATYSNDGKWAAFGMTAAPFIQLYRRKKNTLTRVALPNLRDARVYDLNFGPDNATLYIAYTAAPYAVAYGLNVATEQWSLKPESFIRAFSGHMSALKPSPCGRFLAFAGGNVAWLGVLSKDPSGNWTTSMLMDAVGTGGCSSIDWSKDGTRLFSAVRGNDVFNIHHLGNGDVWQYKANGQGYNLGDGVDISCNDAGNLFAIGTIFSPYFWGVFFWNGTSLTRVATIDSGFGAMYGVSVSRDGKYVCGTGNNNYGDGPRGVLYRVESNGAFTKINNVLPATVGSSVADPVSAFAPPSSAT